MAIRSNLSHTYSVANDFRTRCLAGSSSLLWPNLNPWSVQNVQELSSAFNDNPDLGSRSFLDKLKDQLQPANDDCTRIAADILSFYLLYPDRFTVDAKMEILQKVLSWRQWPTEPLLDDVRTAYEEGGVGYPGTFYNTGRPHLFAFLVELGRLALRQPEKISSPISMMKLCDDAVQQIPTKVSMMRNVALHLMFPESFERMATDKHREAILSHYQELTDPSRSPDDRLREIRQALEAEKGRIIDFYEPEFWNAWGESAIEVENNSIAPTGGAPSIWVEKTIVAGRDDRKSGEYALGKALWSPTRSKNGSDTYHFMRDVRPGDYVLHLTDNAGITALSRAASNVVEFEGVPNTNWEGPGYLVRLKDFRTLHPSLDRDVFLQAPYREQMLALLAGGLRNTFFGREGNLNQGAYLTPATPELMSILNSAYRSVADDDLIPIAGTEVQAGRKSGVAAQPPDAEALKDLQAVQASFSTALKHANIGFGERHEQLTRRFVASLATKPFVILSGLSGSGKTQLALQFGNWCGKDRHRLVPVRPDWTGAEALFGYEDALLPEVRGRRPWYVPIPLEFILLASGDPAHPYVLILDEMNLAHVERYFADALSAMESAEACIPNLVRENGFWYRDVQAPGIAMPRNLFVIGTVNVDETTYMFSPKVLDRANTFEFRVQTSELSGDLKKPRAAEPAPEGLVRGFVEIALDDDFHLAHPHPSLTSFRNSLVALHGLLSTAGFEFGHRVFYEASRFASMYFAAGEESWQEALDMQILQKVLPKIHGSRKKVEPFLTALAQFCFDLRTASSERTDPSFPAEQASVLPASLDKIRRMLDAVRANQFVSFAE